MKRKPPQAVLDKWAQQRQWQRGQRRCAHPADQQERKLIGGVRAVTLCLSCGAISPDAGR